MGGDKWVLLELRYPDREPIRIYCRAGETDKYLAARAMPGHDCVILRRPTEPSASDGG